MLYFLISSIIQPCLMSERQSISICQLISRGDRSSHAILPDELENETWNSVKQIRFYIGRQDMLCTSVFRPHVWKNVCLHLFFLKIYLFWFIFVYVCLFMCTPFMPSEADRRRQIHWMIRLQLGENWQKSNYMVI